MPTKRRHLQALVRWRRAQLIDAGFPRSLAARVARDERYDLHELIELVERGCSPALAADILEPISKKLPSQDDDEQLQLGS
jgi:Glu-tRNA(Gln) amidotransferase subunit E-like FAD-binding protein